MCLKNSHNCVARRNEKPPLNPGWFFCYPQQYVALKNDRCIINIGRVININPNGNKIKNMKQEENYEEIKSKNFKFGGIGDFIKGTLTDVNKTTSKDAYGKLSHIYSVKAEEGSFIGSTKNEKTGKHVQDS